MAKHPTPSLQHRGQTGIIILIAFVIVAASLSIAIYLHQEPLTSMNQLTETATQTYSYIEDVLRSIKYSNLNPTEARNKVMEALTLLNNSLSRKGMMITYHGIQVSNDLEVNLTYTVWNGKSYVTTKIMNYGGYGVEIKPREYEVGVDKPADRNLTFQVTNTGVKTETITVSGDNVVKAYYTGMYPGVEVNGNIVTIRNLKPRETITGLNLKFHVEKTTVQSIVEAKVENVEIADYSLVRWLDGETRENVTLFILSDSGVVGWTHKHYVGNDQLYYKHGSEAVYGGHSSSVYWVITFGRSSIDGWHYVDDVVGTIGYNYIEIAYGHGGAILDSSVNILSAEARDSSPSIITSTTSIPTGTNYKRIYNPSSSINLGGEYSETSVQIKGGETGSYVGYVTAWLKVIGHYDRWVDAHYGKENRYHYNFHTWKGKLNIRLHVSKKVGSPTPLQVILDGNVVKTVTGTGTVNFNTSINTGMHILELNTGGKEGQNDYYQVSLEIYNYAEQADLVASLEIDLDGELYLAPVTFNLEATLNDTYGYKAVNLPVKFKLNNETITTVKTDGTGKATIEYTINDDIISPEPHKTLKIEFKFSIEYTGIEKEGKTVRVLPSTTTLNLNLMTAGGVWYLYYPGDEFRPRCGNRWIGFKQKINCWTCHAWNYDPQGVLAYIETTDNPVRYYGYVGEHVYAIVNLTAWGMPLSVEGIPIRIHAGYDYLDAETNNGGTAVIDLYGVYAQHGINIDYWDGWTNLRAYLHLTTQSGMLSLNQSMQFPLYRPGSGCPT